jgi:hypothetical protein
MLKKYFSYSEFYLYQHDPAKYIDRYINGVEQEPNPEMVLGTILHSAIENKKFDYLKALKESGLDKKKFKVRKILDKVETKRPPKSEVSMFGETKSGIKLYGIFDGFDKENRELIEFKTASDDKWFQGRVDKLDQLSFYAYIYWLNSHAFFKEIRLYAINTEKATIKTFKTARSASDIWPMADSIEKVVKELKAFGLWDKRLGREQINQTKLI